VKGEVDGGHSLVGGRNNDELKGAQRKEVSLSVWVKEPGTRIDGAFISAMLEASIGEVRFDY
jgi:hypothetical protein